MVAEGESVWLVSQGDYSDYSVVAVCTTKENAEVIAAHVSEEWDEATITERVLDPGFDRLREGLTLWSIVLEYRDGIVHNTERVRVHDEDGAVKSGEETPNDRKGSLFITSVWARDKDHAVKVAGERRTRHKALNPNPKEINSR